MLIKKYQTPSRQNRRGIYDRNSFRQIGNVIPARRHLLRTIERNSEGVRAFRNHVSFALMCEHKWIGQVVR